MPYLNNIEIKIKKNEADLKKLINEIELLNLETEQLFSDLNISPEEFATRIENPANFTKEEWDQLQQYKNQLSQKVELSSNYTADPIKTAKTRSDLQLSQNWLFVR